VGKGGIGVGGAYGKGEVYHRGRMVGYSSITQLTLGFQLGGQAYSEIIFFRDRSDLDDFRAGNFEFGAQASAVAVTAGASANAGYSDGVAVFTLVKGGLMYEATIAGQKFNFTPVE
jgi:lipid-binding SYLF domain-containing protein